MEVVVDTLCPARVCTALLATLDASEGRSRARKRDQTPDSIGLLRYLAVGPAIDFTGVTFAWRSGQVR